MFARVIGAAVCSVVLASGQFAGLSANYDGTALYFVSQLRLKGAVNDPLNAKVYRLSPEGVSLFGAHPPAPASDPTNRCAVGGFREYVYPEVAADGSAAMVYRANAVGPCEASTLFTELVTRAVSISVKGVLRISPNGRYALISEPQSDRGFTAVRISWWDRSTDTKRVLKEGAIFWWPPSGARVIADDGTAIVRLAGYIEPGSAFLSNPDGTLEPWPLAGRQPVAISADARTVLCDDLYLYDRKTGTSKQLASIDGAASFAAMSDDGGLVAYLAQGRLHVVDTATLDDRMMSPPDVEANAAALSGDGQVVYYATTAGGMVRAGTRTGAITTLIGRTPYFAYGPPFVVAGFAPILNGGGWGDLTILPSPPFSVFAGNVTAWISEQKVPLIWVKPDSVRMLVPWNQPSGEARVLVELAGEQTPFAFPEMAVSVQSADVPAAGAVAREDWTPTYSGPVRPGEIIHVFASGLGAVSPEVAPGAAAPSTEPLSRITGTFTCDNAEVLYAGLAPGAVERVYQVDLRIGAVPAGYRQFTCTFAGRPGIFLSLNVAN